MKALVEYIKIIGELLLCLIPRHITEKVIVHNKNGDWSTICVERKETSQLKSDNHHRGTQSAFKWFGFVYRSGKIEVETGGAI